jgi:error-prone DNA polymerase
MSNNGYSIDFATRCFDQIEGFGTYGFPESHAASFALLVYVSAWIKCFYPDVFACALLNSQPMGFYAPAQIVRDAGEHGVIVCPPDINCSQWNCTLEPSTTVAPAQAGAQRQAMEAVALGSRFRGNDGSGWALRLGLRQIKGLAEADAERLVRVRGRGAYRDTHDLWRRSGLGLAALERLAAADALGSLGLDRRGGLWAVKALGAAPLPLFADLSRHPGEGRDPQSRRPVAAGMDLGCRRGDEQEITAAALLPAMPLGEHVVEDYATLGLTLKRHPLAFLRAELRRDGLVAAADLAALPVGRRLQIAGLVLIRQRPGSANGVVFITLEDETGIANLIVWPAVLERFRRAALGATLLFCRGRLQREASVIHLVAEDLRDWTPRLRTLRERTGDEPPPSAKQLGKLPERSPGRDARDLIVASRDFR